MRQHTTAERLKEIMDKRGLTQNDILKLCEPYAKEHRIKLGKSILSQYISGTIEPGQWKLTILAKGLNVSETWLMGYDTDEDNFDIFSIPNIGKVSTQKIPMLGDIACGEPMECNEEKEVYVLAGTSIKADFTLTCKGDSMIGARIHDGDIVFCKKQDTCDNGQIAAVIIDNAATLKRVFYYPDKHKLVLQAENPAYEPLVYVNEELNDIRILGVAFAFQSDVR